MLKLYNAAIACKHNNGNVYVSLTNNLTNRLYKFNQEEYVLFRTFSFDNSMPADQIVEQLLQDEFFISNEIFCTLLKRKAKKKVVKTNVSDILLAFKETNQNDLV